MPARTQVPENMMIAQLKSKSQFASPTLGASGKNEKTKPTRRKAREISLMTPPHFPSEKRLGSSGWPRRRFSRTLPMEMIYEKIKAALETERIAWRAALEPKLMAERTRATARQTTNCIMSSVLVNDVTERWTKTYSIRRNLPCRADVADP
jgi:hypothetical protein